MSKCLAASMYYECPATQTHGNAATFQGFQGHLNAVGAYVLYFRTLCTATCILVAQACPEKPGSVAHAAQTSLRGAYGIEALQGKDIPQSLSVSIEPTPPHRAPFEGIRAKETMAGQKNSKVDGQAGIIHSLYIDLKI